MSTSDDFELRHAGWREGEELFVVVKRGETEPLTRPEPKNRAEDFRVMVCVDEWAPEEIAQMQSAARTGAVCIPRIPRFPD